jgi:cobaltochelatase CobT
MMRLDVAENGARTGDAQRLGEATSAVYRALATPPGAALARDPAGRNAANWQMVLAELPRQLKPEALSRWRGRIDSLAFRQRYSDPVCYARFEPQKRTERTLYSLLEQVRVELLAGREFPGARQNLGSLAHERWLRSRPESMLRSSPTAWLETLALLVRGALDAPLPEQALASLREGWRSWLREGEPAEVERLGELVGDQQAYARQSLRVIAAFLAGAAKPEQPQQSQEPEADVQPDEHRAQRVEKAGGDIQETSDAGDPLASVQLREPEPPPARAPGPAAQAYPLYRIYTTEFDAIERATTMRDAATLERMRQELDRLVGNRLDGAVRWAHKLQRRLQSLQTRYWQFDLEEGVLDAARLTRLVTHPFEPLSYKIEQEREFPDTLVTLLIDNSGSMRGVPIANAALCAELLGRVLERCGVKTEILGFTTRGWRGGRARAKWVAAGRPANPGRVSELLHVVYKSADEPWRRARQCLGLMLDSNMLRENVDGEALLWAHARMMSRPEHRRILIVISDGAPLDDATLDANDPQYLERHLQATIESIEQHSPVELVAIGIGHDVTRYYRRAVTLANSDTLGEAIVGQLLELFERPDARRRAPPRPGARP